MKRAILLCAVAVAALAAASASIADHGPPAPDPNGILDLPAGYSYDILATSCTDTVRSTESGATFQMPEDFDANVLFPVRGHGGHHRLWLLNNHELTQPRPGDWQGDAIGQCPVNEQATGDDGDSDAWGSVSRLTLDRDGRTVVNRELITTGLHNLCAANPTAWGTYLAGEEFPYGRRIPANDPQKRSGWLWEIDPATGQAVKASGLGWMSHEQADYLHNGDWWETDDQGDRRFIYKFVPDDNRDLQHGRLYGLKFNRATMTGVWIGPLNPLDPDADMRARGHNPATDGFLKAEGLVASENRHWIVFSESGSGNDPGRVWRFRERHGIAEGEVIAEGDWARLSRPDNLRYAPSGDLYIFEDNGSSLGRAGGFDQVWILPKHEEGGANLQLFAQTADYEPTGPWFSDDGDTLYLSVQGGPEVSPPLPPVNRSHVLAISGDFRHHH